MKKGTVLALLTALSMVSLLTGCGSDSTDTATGEASQEISSAASADESTESEADSDSDAEESSGDESESSASESSSKEKSESSKKDESSKEKSTENSKAKDDSSSGASKENSDSGSTGGNNTGNTGGSTGGNTSGNAGSNTGGSTGNTENSTPDEDAEEETEPTKYIYLKDTTAQFSGDGISVSGSVIKITAGGSYEISGNLNDGQILVQTDSNDKKKVKLRLNGVSIKNSAGSAINCQCAKKISINALAGTVNYLEDGGTHDEDKGTIFSEDTVTLKGEGELNIIANYAHGVQSDDDIVVNGGNINIQAAKSCLHSNDGIEINGGNLFCDGGTNGIKTDGYIMITGGTSIFLGGVREEKGAIYCDGTFTVTGGEFWALGNTCTEPDASVSMMNVVGVVFPSSQAGGTLVNLTSGGNTIFTMTSPRNFKYAVYSGPSLATGAEYAVSYGGSCDGNAENYIYSGSYSGGTDGGTFTADDLITFYAIP